MQKSQKSQRLRIYIDECDTCDGKLLYKWIVLKAHDLNMAGATVLRGTMGYGATSQIHSAGVLRLSEDLPMIIEIVDSAEKIKKFVPVLDKHVKEGLITLEEVEVIRYRHDSD